MVTGRVGVKHTANAQILVIHEPQILTHVNFRVYRSHIKYPSNVIPKINYGIDVPGNGPENSGSFPDGRVQNVPATISNVIDPTTRGAGFGRIGVTKIHNSLTPIRLKALTRLGVPLSPASVLIKTSTTFFPKETSVDIFL